MDNASEILTMRVLCLWALLVIVFIIKFISDVHIINRYRVNINGRKYTTSLSVIAQWRKDSIMGRIDTLTVGLFYLCCMTFGAFVGSKIVAEMCGVEIAFEMMFDIKNESHKNIVRILTHEFWLFRFVGLSVIASWLFFIVRLIGTCSIFSFAKWLAHNDVNYSLVLTNRIDNSVKKHKRLNKMNEGSKGSVREGCLLNVRPSTKTILCIHIGVLLIINILISWFFVKLFRYIDELTLLGAIILLLLCILFLIKIVFNFVFNRIVRRRSKLLTEVPSNSRISDAKFKQENRKLIKNLLVFVLILALIVGALCVTYMSQELVYSVSNEGDSYVVGRGAVVLRTHISIPTTHNGMTVTTIGDGAFAGCYSLTSIEIPHTVTSIGIGAFEYCSSLESVVIPNGVMSIGDSAFNECGFLRSVSIPDSVTSIGYAVFRDCRELKSIHFEGTVAQWTTIEKSLNWDSGAGKDSKYTIYCTDGEIAKGGTVTYY